MRKISIIKLNLLAIVAISVMMTLFPHSAFATSSVSIATPASLDLTLLPNTDGAIDYTTNDLTVTTKDTAGFRIMLSGSSNLTNKHHPDTISTLTKPTTLVALPINTWGVYLGAKTPTNTTTFSPISTTPTEIITNDLSDSSGTYKLALGAKADTALPAGAYTGQIIISVIAIPKEVTSLADATYMQDITPEICANSKIWESEADSATLIDKRDGKSYKVARLKDGNCWMQENLALTLSTDTPLTSEDSDIAPNEDGSVNTWTPEISTSTELTDYSGTDTDASWDRGNYLYYRFNAATAGSGYNITNEVTEASYSICPKGWKLPIGDPDSNTVNGSFYNLFAKYNVVNSLTGIMSDPLNFIVNGFMTLGGRQLAGYGSSGYSWSRNFSATTVYGLSFSSYGIYPSDDHKRAEEFGFPVRCIVTLI